MKKCTPLWREAHFQVKMDKALEERTTFGSWDVEKVHAVVARSTFWSQNVQNTPWNGPLTWKFATVEVGCGQCHVSERSKSSFWPWCKKKMCNVNYSDNGRRFTSMEVAMGGGKVQICRCLALKHFFIFLASSKCRKFTPGILGPLVD